MIKSTLVETHLPNLSCDVCEDRAVASETILMSHPPPYQYLCPDGCVFSYSTTKASPYLEYEEVECLG